MADIALGGESAPVTCPPFDPTSWLDRFRSVGGWWIINADDKISVGVMLEGFTNAENEEAGTMFRGIWGHLENRAAIREHLLTNTGEVRYGQA